MKRKLLITIIVLLILILVLVFFSSKPKVTHYSYTSERIPEDFEDFKIVHLSDIHCKNFGKDNSDLVNKINSLEPDLILITGDSIDKFHPDITPLENLFKGIADTAPIYSISGNHECDNSELYAQLLKLYQKYNITDLDDSAVFINRNESSILIKGLGAFQNKLAWDKNFMENKYPEVFSILLDHYPQPYQLGQYEYDIILSGHIHGGVIRIPFIGGLINNDGSLFPEFDAGEYKYWKSTMYVSRGLGDTLIPRINNSPEIICITLHSKKINKNIHNH